jgi:hypothetical protein
MPTIHDRTSGIRTPRSRRAVRLLVTLFAMAATLVTAVPAHAANGATAHPGAVTPNVQTGLYRNLVNDAHGILGRCLDADANTIGGNGTKVQLWDCNGQSQQYWALTPSGQGYQIKNLRSGRCLDADTNTAGHNGGRVQLWDCNGQPQQQWIVLDTWIVDGNTEIDAFYTPYDNRCLDADLNTIGGNGTKVQVYNCMGILYYPNQYWAQLQYA